MKVLMVCSGGMSSSIVVEAIKKEAEKQNFPLEIKAVGTGEFADELRSENYDMALVAPQVKHRMKIFEEEAKGLDVVVELIVQMGYTPIGAPKVLAQIKKHLK